MFEADISLLKPGEFLYKGGNTAAEFYIILFGRVIFVDEWNGRSEYAEIGQVVGEELLVGKSIRPFESCKADIESALIHVPYFKWKEMAKSKGSKKSEFLKLETIVKRCAYLKD